MNQQTPTSRTIRSAQVRLLLTVAGTALTLCVSLFIVGQTILFTRHSNTSLHAEAKLVAENLLPALIFQDFKDAQRVIKSLETDTDISSARVLGPNKQLIAEYKRSTAEGRSIANHTGLICEVTPIVADGIIQGYLEIDSDRGKIKAMYRNIAATTTVVMAFCLVLAYLLAVRGARRLTEPLELFLKTAQQIEEQGDYKLRIADKISATGLVELDNLQAHFDSMLDYVQKRDRHLDAEVEERTQQLMETKENLVNQAKLSALGEMAGGIAHEINNPLAIISARTQQLIKQIQKSAFPDAPSYTEKLERITINITRIEKIIRSLRSFLRDGTNDPYEPVLIKALIDDAFELCQARFKNHGVELRASDFPPHLAVRGSATQLGQILINLLNNAYDAVQPLETPWIAVDVRHTETDVMITVSNSGPGIPKELREKIGRPFFTTKPIGKGTGLGVSISRTIAEKHGGNLILDPHSEMTRFTLTVPRLDQQEAKAA
jgi:C4-dicarboxylate-specific signal transduction histidine kinase